MSRKERLNQLFEAPEAVLPRYDLVYVDDRDFPIQRIGHGKGFSYKLRGRPLKSKKQLERIRELAIPPAWKHVKITDLANGHLQAVGRDKRDRKQYRYHPGWSKVRNSTKFYNMAAFGQILPSIRKRVERDLDQKGWPRTKVLALVVGLLEETHIRIGNRQYARENKTYGLSTLRKKHVEVQTGSMQFEFTGKKGKKHIVGLRNKKLIRLVHRSMDIPGWELFQYYGPEGEKKSLDSSMVNAYLHEIGNDHFTAKDFRSWGASLIFFNTLMELGTTSHEKDIRDNLSLAYDAGAKALGNTKTVCRNHYVHPFLDSAYRDGSIKAYFDPSGKQSDEGEYFSRSEALMLKLIKKYRPDGPNT